MLKLLYRILPYYQELDDDVKYNLRIDGLASLIYGLFAGVIYPYTSIIAVRLGASNFLVGFVSSAPFVGQLFAIYWGHRSALSPRKTPIIVWAGLISRLLIIPLALFTSPLVFVLLVVLHNMIATFATPAYNGLLKKIYPDQYRGRLMGLVKLLICLTHVSATYIAGWWIDVWGFKSIFLIAGLLGLISSMVYFWIKEEKVEVPTGKTVPFSLEKVYQICKRDKAMVWCTAAFFIFGFGNLFSYAAYPIYQVKVAALTTSQIRLLSVFNLPVWFLTYPLWGWINDRTRSMVNIYIGMALYGLAPLIYLWHPSFTMMVVASCIQGAAGASQDVGYINQLIKMGGEDADHYMGIYGTFLGLRGIIAPILGSVLIGKIGYSGVFIISAVLIYLGIIPMSMVERKMEKATAVAVN